MDSLAATRKGRNLCLFAPLSGWLLNYASYGCFCGNNFFHYVTTIVKVYLLYMNL